MDTSPDPKTEPSPGDAIIDPYAITQLDPVHVILDLNASLGGITVNAGGTLIVNRMPDPHGGKPDPEEVARIELALLIEMRDKFLGLDGDIIHDIASENMALRDNPAAATIAAAVDLVIGIPADAPTD